MAGSAEVGTHPLPGVANGAVQGTRNNVSLFPTRVHSRNPIAGPFVSGSFSRPKIGAKHALAHSRLGCSSLSGGGLHE